MTTKFTMAVSICLTLGLAHSSRADFSLSFSGDVTNVVGASAGETFHGTLMLHQTGTDIGRISGTGAFHYESGPFSLTKLVDFSAMVGTIEVNPSFEELQLSLYDPGTESLVAYFHMEASPEIDLPNTIDLLANGDLNMFGSGHSQLTVYDPAYQYRQPLNAKIHGTITQFTATPEPASLVLFATAFGGLVAGRRTVFRRNA